jgi:hypothetical protein
MSGRQLLDLLAAGADDPALAERAVQVARSMDRSQLEAAFDLALRSGLLDYQRGTWLRSRLGGLAVIEGADFDDELAPLRAEVARLEAKVAEQKSIRPREAALRGEVAELERQRVELSEAAAAARRELATISEQEAKLMQIRSEVAT